MVMLPLKPDGIVKINPREYEDGLYRTPQSTVIRVNSEDAVKAELIAHVARLEAKIAALKAAVDALS